MRCSWKETAIPVVGPPKTRCAAPAASSSGSGCRPRAEGSRSIAASRCRIFRARSRRFFRGREPIAARGGAPRSPCAGQPALARDAHRRSAERVAMHRRAASTGRFEGRCVRAARERARGRGRGDPWGEMTITGAGGEAAGEKCRKMRLQALFYRSFRLPRRAQTLTRESTSARDRIRATGGPPELECA